MRPGPVLRAMRGALTRRRVQAAVIGVVLLVSTGASVLGLALAVDSNAPFDHAFAAQRGADATALVDSAAEATAIEQIETALNLGAGFDFRKKRDGPGLLRRLVQKVGDRRGIPSSRISVRAPRRVRRGPGNLRCASRRISPTPCRTPG